MKQNFTGLWAGGSPDARREPNSVEIAGGYPCGPLDRDLDNGLNYSWTQAFAELSNVISLSGQTANEGDLTQVWKAILLAVANGSPAFHYGVAGGTSTALTVATTTPAIKIPYGEGAVALVRMPSNLSVGNNATIKFGLSGATAAMLRNDGSSVRDGDGPGGTFVLLGWNGSNWKLLVPGQAEFPKILGTGTIYVATDGNDANDGRTTGTALRTVGEALTRATRYYLLGQALTIKLTKPGTYPLPAAPPSLSGSLIIQGDPAAQGGYILQGSTGGSSASVIGSGGADLMLEGLTVLNPTTTRYTVASTGGGRLTLNRVTLTSTATLVVAHVYCTGASQIEIGTNVIWASSASSMMAVRKGEIALTTNSASVVQGTLAWSEAAAVAFDCGTFIVRSGASITGSATGLRYRSFNNAVINAGGAGFEFFPGDQPGTTATGGLYNP